VVIMVYVVLYYILKGEAYYDASEDTE
jgi:hypothetical protein